MKPKKIEEVDWEEMTPHIETQEVSNMQGGHYIVSKLPIIGCYSTAKSIGFVIKPYGELAACFENHLGVLFTPNQLDYELKNIYNRIRGLFEKLQKRKMFEYTEDDGTIVRKRINYLLPISSKDFYGLGKETKNGNITLD